MNVYKEKKKEKIAGLTSPVNVDLSKPKLLKCLWTVCGLFCRFEVGGRRGGGRKDLAWKAGRTFIAGGARNRVKKKKVNGKGNEGYGRCLSGKVSRYGKKLQRKNKGKFFCRHHGDCAVFFFFQDALISYKI